MTSLGTGIYTPADAARLTGIPASRLRRRAEAGSEALAFLDLVEEMFVDALLRAGASPAALERAEHILGGSHPFCHRSFALEGATALAQAAREAHHAALLELASRPILEPVSAAIDFDSETGVAALWWPLGKHAPIVVDPQRRFGHPIVLDRGVPTRVVADVVAAGESPATIAAWYEITEAEALAACELEARLDQRAAA